MKKLALLTAALLATSVALSTPFANTNAGGKLYICATPQNNPIANAGAYAALTWVEIVGVGSVGEMGTSTNILTYDTWADDVMDKGKGMSDAGSPTIELSRTPTDAGQILLNAAALVNQKYAFKIVLGDPIIIGGVGTTIYTRGLVTGPTRPMGRNEDFVLETFTLGLVQREIVVAPTSGNPPVNTVLPAITGTVQVAQVLTASNGTWVGDATITYTKQWRSNGVPIVGATANTYTPVAGDVGKYLSCTVTGTNAAGSAVATTASTIAVAP